LIVCGDKANHTSSAPEYNFLVFVTYSPHRKISQMHLTILATSTFPSGIRYFILCFAKNKIVYFKLYIYCVYIASIWQELIHLADCSVDLLKQALRKSDK